jgi:hypothetical protein
MELPQLVAAFLNTLSDVLSQPVLRIGTKNGRPYADIVFESAPRQSIDDRIAKIDAARSNLAEALSAIDELKSAANANKADLEAALEQLGQTQAAKTAAERELGAVRKIADADIEVFQRLAGVPTRSQVAKERALGFLFGVIASLLASGVWWSIAKFWPIFRS